MTTMEIDEHADVVDHDRPEAPSPEAPELDESAEVDLAAVLEENRSLRAYLKRVLEMLEVRIEESAEQRAPMVAPAGSLAASVGPVHLVDLDRRLRRAEETIDDLLWLMRRTAPSATITVD